MRSLFAPRPMPYYVYALNYRRSSAGIRVMHMLCDALIRSGHEAYVVADVFGPELMTPKLTDDVVAQHRAAGLKPIAVYPEIIDGNPLNCEVVVRYLLNKPGFIEGSGEYGENDLFFAYKSDFYIPNMPVENHLYLPPVDPNIFCPPADPSRRVPGRICYYLGRNSKIDVSLLPDDAIKITSDYPDSWQGLADLFQQCEYLYMGEASGLGYEAGLCGCLPVLVSEKWSCVGPDPTSFMAFGLDPEEIARARSFLPGVSQLLEYQRTKFWPELDYFIEVTQKAALAQRSGSKDEIEQWLAERLPTPVQRHQIHDHLLANAGGPSIGVVVLDPEGREQKVKATLDSLSAERFLYANTQVTVLTSRLHLNSINATEASVVRWDGSTTQLNEAIRAGNADWLMLVDAGDEFTPSGLMIAALDLLGAPGCRAVYGDEVMRQEGGALGLALRSGPNLDLLLSFPAVMSRHWLLERKVWLDMGGYRTEAGRAFELDYLLRLIESQGLAGLGHISEPLLTSHMSNIQDNPDEREVIVRHLHARGFANGRVDSRLPGRYELDYGHVRQPKVSILVVVKDSLALVQRCLTSLLERTAYANFEVLLLDHGNTRPEIVDWLAGIERMGAKGLRVLCFNATSSRVHLQNQAALQATGEFLLWLGDGAGILSADWLKQLLNHALRPEVGAVGGKLVSADGLILHAGGILGLGGPVGRAFQGHKIDDPGYLQRLQVDQSYSVLSGLCLMVRRDLFIELGGFVEDKMLERWADADLCLRLQQAGYLNVWTSRAQLLMDEPPLSPASTEEEDVMYGRWLPVLAHDPAYNPNFGLNSQQGFKLAPAKFTWKPLQALGAVPLVLAHNADSTGCGHYRVIQPHRALREAGLIDGLVEGSYLSVCELERYNPASIILQRQVGDTHFEQLRRMKSFSRAFKVFELDDYLPKLPPRSAHRKDLPPDIVKSLRRALTCVDRLVVSTEPLAHALKSMHSDIHVVLNRLDPRWWQGLESRRRVSSKPRVGWAGGAGHAGDLEMIADVVKELANEVDWVFFGMCPNKLRPYVHEFHPGVAIEQYPVALASLNLDLALAPVEQNLFNECKSNLRLLEYGACGFPVVCSDLVCYRGDLPVTRVKNRFKDWVDAIRMHLADLDATAKQGEALRAAVFKNWMLEGENLELWRKAWLP